MQLPISQEEVSDSMMDSYATSWDDGMLISNSTVALQISIHTCFYSTSSNGTITFLGCDIRWCFCEGCEGEVYRVPPPPLYSWYTVVNCLSPSPLHRTCHLRALAVLLRRKNFMNEWAVAGLIAYVCFFFLLWWMLLVHSLTKISVQAWFNYVLSMILFWLSNSFSIGFTSRMNTI